MGCGWPRWPPTWAAANMPPRRCWSGRGPRCAASTGRRAAVMPDPLDALRLPVVPVEPRPEFAATLLRRMEGRDESVARQAATVRYFVTDLATAVAFYRDLLGFEVELRPSPAFAMLYRGDLRLLLSVPGTRAAVTPCPMAACPRQAAGTGSRCGSATWTRPSRTCAPGVPA